MKLTSKGCVVGLTGHNDRGVQESYHKFACTNTGSIGDDPYWTSRKNSSELIELSSINKVSLV